jgi:isopenicillin N synthase-like dioxygenase
LVQRVFALSQQFFGQPLAQKERAAFSGPSGNRGWIRLGNETLDPSKPFDMKEAFNIGLELGPDDPDIIAGKPFRGINCWPDIVDFRTTMLAYFDACWNLGRILHHGFAIDLGLPPDYFATTFDRPMATLRLLHYPPQPANAAPGEKGAGAHSDFGGLTLLLQDTVGGLQVQGKARDEWIHATPVPGAFVVNLGDMIARWTNDRFRSTVHRVVNASGRERYSVPFFFSGNPDQIVECLPSCLESGELPKYPRTTVEGHLREMYRRTYK